jgi:hypothetical protein
LTLAKAWILDGNSNCFSIRFQHLFPGSSGQMNKLDAKSHVCYFHFCSSLMTLALCYSRTSSHLPHVLQRHECPVISHYQKRPVACEFLTL